MISQHSVLSTERAAFPERAMISDGEAVRLVADADERLFIHASRDDADYVVSLAFRAFGDADNRDS